MTDKEMDMFNMWCVGVKTITDIDGNIYSGESSEVAALKARIANLELELETYKRIISE